MNKLPPHIENEIIKNPTAVLTSRGLVKPNAGGIDELLIGIPNAAELYGEHFNLIRKQEINKDAIKPKAETNDKPDSKVENSVPTKGETTDIASDLSGNEGEPTEHKPESTADTEPQAETKETESTTSGTDDDVSKEELQQKSESVALTPEEKKLHAVKPCLMQRRLVMLLRKPQKLN